MRKLRCKPGEIARLKNLLEQYIKASDPDNAYEIAELLYILTGGIDFVKICFDLSATGMPGKDIPHLLNACPHSEVTLYLAGVYLAMLKHWERSIKLFRKSLSISVNNERRKIRLFGLDPETLRPESSISLTNLDKAAWSNIAIIQEHFKSESKGGKTPEEVKASISTYQSDQTSIERVLKSLSRIENTILSSAPREKQPSKSKPPTPSMSGREELRLPPGTEWEDIKIVFDIDFRTVKYSCKGKRSTKVNYSDMKFPKSKSSDEPGMWWRCFVNIALIDKYVREAKSIVPDPKKDTSRAIDPDTKAPIKIHGYGSNSKTEILEPSRLPSTPRANVSHVRDTLIEFFGIDDDPFYEKRKYGYHKAKFQIEIFDPDDLLNIRYKK